MSIIPAQNPPIDEIMTIQDVSTDTLFTLVNRIELSTTIDHFFSRETELDEVWRHARADVDMAIRCGETKSTLLQLELVRDTIFEVHDLIGEGKSVEAAAKLRGLMRP
jgi:hypothetical protein